MKLAPHSDATAFAINVFPQGGRAVEEDALTRGHAELDELVRVLHRVLDGLLELALDVL